LLNDKNNDIPDICFSLQETAFSIIVEAVERALAFTGIKEFLIVGGVSANKRLSKMLETACEIYNSNFNSCPPRYCGDNGAQIAWTGAQMYLNNPSSSVKPENAPVIQSWRLDSVHIPWR
jgi:tRNA A37 threonylcarbamoyltransferase TsaD